MLLALTALDGSQLGSHRAAVYSHDKKKKHSYTEGHFGGKTPVVLVTLNTLAF